MIDSETYYLLKKFKKSIGVLEDDNSLDELYLEKLKMAKSDLESEDISREVLSSELGCQTQILYAQALVDEKDVATHPTLIFLRNKLSSMTKGKRYESED